MGQPNCLTPKIDTPNTNKELNNLNKEIINYMWIDKNINEPFFDTLYYNILFDEKKML